MDFVFLLIAIFGFVLTLLVLLKKNANKAPQLFLASFYLIYSIYTLQTYIINTGFLYELRWFYIWPLPIYSLIVVPIYFYFLTVMNNEFKWKWIYLILFIPFILSIIDVAIVFSKPASFYNQILDNAITFPERRFKAQYSFFSLNEHYILRHLWQLIYLLSLIPLLRRFVALRSSDNLKTILNRWLLIFFISLISMAFITTFFGIDRLLELNLLHVDNESLYDLQIILYLVLLAISILPLYFPSILYGFPKNTVFLSESKKN